MTNYLPKLIHLLRIDRQGLNPAAWHHRLPFQPLCCSVSLHIISRAEFHTLISSLLWLPLYAKQSVKENDIIPAYSLVGEKGMYQVKAIGVKGGGVGPRRIA